MPTITPPHNLLSAFCLLTNNKTIACYAHIMPFLSLSTIRVLRVCVCVCVKTKNHLIPLTHREKVHGVYKQAYTRVTYVTSTHHHTQNNGSAASRALRKFLKDVIKTANVPECQKRASAMCRCRQMMLGVCVRAPPTEIDRLHARADCARGARVCRWVNERTSRAPYHHGREHRAEHTRDTHATQITRGLMWRKNK